MSKVLFFSHLIIHIISSCNILHDGFCSSCSKNKLILTLVVFDIQLNRVLLFHLLSAPRQLRLYSNFIMNILLLIYVCFCALSLIPYGHSGDVQEIELAEQVLQPLNIDLHRAWQRAQDSSKVLETGRGDRVSAVAYSSEALDF